MQKSTKRLLSMLAVLALVLTMAPGGILAVETKADGTEPEIVYGSANLTETQAATKKAGAEKQDAALEIIDALTGADADTRLAELNESHKTCPFCGATDVSWRLLSNGAVVNYFGKPNRHYYAYGEYNITGNALLYGSADDSAACLLMDDATITTNTRIFMEKKAKLSIGGNGAITTSMGFTTYAGTIGMIHVTGAAEVNIYGGTFVNTSNLESKPALYVSNAGAVVNIWSDDVYIGPAVLDETKATYNCFINKGELNLYDGTIRNGVVGSSGNNMGANVLVYADGTFNMYGGTVTGGSYVTTGTTPAGNGASGVNVQCRGEFNMYGGTISNGKAYSYHAGSQVLISNIIPYTTSWPAFDAATHTPATANIIGGTITGGINNNDVGFGGNINVGGHHNLGASYNGAAQVIIGGTALIDGGLTTGNNCAYGGNICVGLGSTLTVNGGKIQNGAAKTSGGNIYLRGAGAELVVNDGIITGGVTKGNGGNLSMAGTSIATVKGELTNGHANLAGNFFVDGGASLTLDGATVSDGVIDYDSALQTNGRVNVGTLTLKNGANCPGGVLILNDATSIVNVDKSFSGIFEIWHNVAAEPGAAVKYLTCNGPFTGVFKNGNWLYAAAAGDQSDVYIDLAMEWDGATGLKYAAQGVVYNGTLTPAASGQAAVDAYVAAMADEEVEEKPQYVYITEDVQLKDGAEVAIWAGSDITVSGTGTVYGVDRANDNYTATAGSITADGVTVAEEVTAGGRRYIALSDATVDANKYTFHRVEAALTNVTVNKDNAGMYYKAQYKFDAKVAEQVASYGVLVKLNEAVNAENYANKTTATDAATAYDAETATLTAKSHGVYGIFKTTNDAAVNVENGNTKLFGNPYIMIGDEMFTAAQSTGMSLADAMVRANTVWEKMSEEDQANLNAFVSEWKALNAWSEDVLELLDNFTIA